MIVSNYDVIGWWKVLYVKIFSACLSLACYYVKSQSNVKCDILVIFLKQKSKTLEQYDNWISELIKRKKKKNFLWNLKQDIHCSGTSALEASL